MLTFSHVADIKRAAVARRTAAILTVSMPLVLRGLFCSEEGSDSSGRSEKVGQSWFLWRTVCFFEISVLRSCL